ncbi:MAG: electron transport complex subunit RsxC [Clostridia bacterium]|nr:electron transport complex subunit RsxC [Clostridia bacterium]
MSLRKGKRYAYGIHVPDKKYLSADCPIEVMPAPAKVYISLSQHIGAPAIPVVSVGDYVRKGQLIGEASGAISANVHSSVSGTVIAIDDIVNGLGQKQKHVVIDNDFKYEETLLDDMTDFSPSSLVERIRLAGIVGLGGAGFPTAVKLSPKVKLDTLVINGAECEPYLNCDNRLMLERTEDVYKGIMYAARALDIHKVILGIEANKPQAIEKFAKEYPDLEIVVLKRQYPMGSEKHLIYCTTGRKVPTGKMPFDVGVSVQNIKTVIACYEAIELNKPLTEIVMTVSGEGIKTPKNLKVSIGTPFTDIIAFCGGENGVVKAVAGGPMMGRALGSFNSFVRKTDSGILLLTEKETSLDEPTNCINCARCAYNCPMRLMPMYIEFYALAGDFKNAEKYGAMNCIECGSCAYNCPAKRPLVQSIQNAKAKIKEMKANGK